MAITRRLSWPKLLFLFVWLCLALDPNSAARVPSDRFAFPSESQPNATAIRLESRIKEIDRELEEVTRMTKISLLIPEENKKGTPRTTDAENKSEKPGNTSVEARNVTEITSNSMSKPIQVSPSTPKNQAHQSSESKMITFAKEPDSDKTAPWDQTEPTVVSNRSSVVIGPRITLETLRICPAGTTLSNDHCRKIA
ncbi:uncharacterized protein LOC128253684 [Drosophila gunungcola]|uniref:uncharacterized protein LOC128253684 n=1 Tax=Drosophila gunungcola TaxID=103775 RepID=UPI0022E515CA|nr:uncharacterized protein LOC128253684 [Drosophila gunungcola]